MPVERIPRPMNDSKRGNPEERTESKPLYPSGRTFVVRVPRDAGPIDANLLGHVEHIPSGSGREFTGTDDLLAFIRRVLSTEG